MVKKPYKIKKETAVIFLVLFAIFCVYSFINGGNVNETETSVGTRLEFDINSVPEYSGSPFVAVCGNMPDFTEQELSMIGEEVYSSLDSLGRCTAVFAVCGNETRPKQGEKRGDIGHIKPTGWIQKMYDFVDGQALYNRCHLIGWQLSAENDNERNLITGTRYMNTQGMLPFENMIADYIKETGNHVAYRVTPIFEGNNLVCSGVLLEAYSVEDKGDEICFAVYCYNVQPGVKIDYKTGKNNLANE